MGQKIKSLKQLVAEAYLKNNPDLLDQLRSDEKNNKLTVEFEKPIPQEIRSIFITYAPLNKKTVIMQLNRVLRIHDTERINECINFINEHGVHANPLQMFYEGIKFGWQHRDVSEHLAEQQLLNQFQMNTIELIQENKQTIEPNIIKYDKVIKHVSLFGWAIGDELYDSKQLVCESLAPIIILSAGFYLSKYFL